MSFVIVLCMTLIVVSGCSRSHVQETVTVAPRATPVPSRATTDATNDSSAPLAVDAEVEAAGDTLAHAIVALKTKRRNESLYYMNLTRTRLIRLTHRLNRSATEASAISNPARDSLINDLRELDAAERSARHNDYAQSGAHLILISDELDRLNASFIHRQN
jgi:uncharacterized protein YicC (UPF0701 family)